MDLTINNMKRKTNLKIFKLHWVSGETEILTGITIANAFNRAGYGAGAIFALDWYETL